MFTSPYPKIEIPNISVYECIFDTLTDDDLTRVALVDSVTGAPTTFGELKTQVNALGGALAARGVQVGTVVAVLCPNIPAFATVFHGALRIGATLTTINSLYTAREITGQLLDAGASWLVTVSALLPQAQEAARAAQIPADRLIVLDGAPGHPNLAQLLTAGEQPPPVDVDPATHVAVLPYSSGTAGEPKGVMLSHRNLVANVEQCRAIIDVTPEDRLLAVLPFFHIYGMTVLLNLALRQRARLVTMPRFDLVEFLDTIEKYGCTYIFIAPPIAVALAKHPIVDQYDISSVRTIFSGAAPLDAETGEAAAKRLHARMLQGYGMTEMSPVSHVTPPASTTIPVSSVGVLIPNQECKIVDVETGAEITDTGPDGVSAPGELWVRGPNIMLGYLGRAEETGETLDSEGLLHTGDVAVYHEDGYFFIVDRVKELIKYKGYQVAPAELEAVLLTNPKIADAAVIGSLDEDGQEIPKAFVVPAPEAELSAAEVMDHVAEEVAPYKKVRAVEFLDAIPKSSSGKILRRDLRAREQAGTATDS